MQRIRAFFKKRRRWVIAGLLLFIAFLLIPLPDPLFQTPYSTVLEDREGNLLAAKIANDGQWRFPQGGSVPEKFEQCILHFEDEYFYKHPGVNPFSMYRAFRQNLKAGRVISGGSTLSMQVIRLSRRGKERSFWQKGIEVLMAIRLEWRYSKAEILRLYTDHAPFGGNVVGLEAASWRYFERPPDQLSWGETAALAVLPNAPSLIYPGKNQERLKKKRDRLLQKLSDKGIITPLDAQLAMDEALPSKPHALPQIATHLLSRVMEEGGRGKRLRTTVLGTFQNRANAVVDRYYQFLKQNEVHNLAALIIDNRSNEVMAYVGNTNGLAREHGHQVDIIRSSRSTGSLLKPFLYAAAWQEGDLVPPSILADIPTQFSGYAPKNFNRKYDGAVPANEALIRSLNVPAVRLLRSYGLERFYEDLQQLSLKSINRSARNYGLSLILGGAEASMWELCTAYKGYSQRLSRWQERAGTYSMEDFLAPTYLLGEATKPELPEENGVEVAAIWQMMESLSELSRPGQEEGWQLFAGRRKVAWKTGTSFGLRDAWAIGVCPEFTVGVWVGNADGEGRPGLTGIHTAAPVMFRLFQLLPESSWYTQPKKELFPLLVCSESGYQMGPHCLQSDSIWVGRRSLELKGCPYHRMVQLDQSGQHRVNSSCYPVAEMKEASYFVLPPMMEWFYRKKEPSHQTLPPWQAACQQSGNNPMQLVTPEHAEKVLIPVDLEGKKGRLVVQVVHRSPQAKLFWHLNDEYLGESYEIHQKELAPEVGHHVLTIVDQAGNSLIKPFEVVD